MDEQDTDVVPLASPAAWSPTAAPHPAAPARLLSLDGEEEPASADPPAKVAPQPNLDPVPVRALGPTVDRLAALRDIARRLRSAPESDETLQFVIDQACRCTGSGAGMLTVSTSGTRQFVSGATLGAGAQISMPLRAGGPTFGEIVLTRMAGGEEYHPEDETFSELVAEYVAKAISTLRSGTVLSQEEQDFVDRVTEEMRSPLAGAVNTLAVVLAGECGPLPDDARAYVATAASDTRRLLGTIDDLIVLAHLRPPEQRHLEAIPVGPWLQRSAERFRAAADDRGVTITILPAGEPHVIQGVPATLDVVIGQLIGNAIKFSQAGGLIDIRTDLVEGFVRITVRDTGIGFDPSEAGRLTECFARARTAEQARIPGLGVGLFLANEIVKHHGGRLWLEGMRDDGTAAHLALQPRAEGA
jgi:signal transduction histidine kinase